MEKNSAAKKSKNRKNSKSKKMGSKVSAAPQDLVDKVILKSDFPSDVQQSDSSSPQVTQSKIKSLSEEAIAVFNSFPTDVLEEIFVRLINFPAIRKTPSSWKTVSQVCKSWHAINTSNTFWYKATLQYFPEFIASPKHDPGTSFMQEFKKLACQIYDMKTMGITWLNENYWVTATTEEKDPINSKDLPKHMPAFIFPCKNVLLPEAYARLDSVCWLDVRTYGKVTYPCTAKLLVCFKMTGGHLNPLNVEIHAGVKNTADDKAKWEKLKEFVWSKEDIAPCNDSDWMYVDLGTVDVDNINGHGLETIELMGQIWDYSGDWKSGLCISHLKLIHLPKH